MGTSVVRGWLAAPAGVIRRRLAIVRQRLRALGRKDALDRELDRELAFHLEQLTAEYVADGLPPREAEAAARRAMGNLPLISEACRDTRRATWFHDLRQDLAYGIRVLAKNPGFSAVVVVSLALGIGANTAVVSVMDNLLRDPLPLADSGRVVIIRAFPRSDPAAETHASWDDYFAWRDRNRVFDVVGISLGHNADFGADPGAAPVERVPGHWTSGETFRALGVEPLLGRVLTEDDTRTAPANVIVISHRLWQRRFGGDPGIVGRKVRVSGAMTTIVGVMPPEFHYPSHVVEYWLPFRTDRPARSTERLFVVTARLKADVTLAQAQADLDRIAWQLGREVPRLEGWSVRVRRARDVMYGWALEPLLTLGAAVALVLLVACANVAGLLLARSLVREPEMALRIALGAKRGRLVRQLLAESALLALIGGVLGVAVAWGGVRALAALQPPPGALRIVEPAIDVRLLAVSAAVSLATGLLFGLAPAWMGVAAKAGDIARGRPNGRSGAPRFREALVAAQIAVTFVLLIGAGLMTASFERLMSRELHFRAERLLSFELHLPPSTYLRARAGLGAFPYFSVDPVAGQTLQRVRDTVGGLPGVESVAGVSQPLLNALVVPSMRLWTGPPEARPGSEPSQASTFLVTPGFFTSIGAQLTGGRDFTGADTTETQWAAIVNETAARRFWPGENPIGKTLHFVSVPDERPREVIAVVRDIPLRLQSTDSAPVVYTSYLQQPANLPLPGANVVGRMVFLVRTTGDPLALASAVRREVGAIVPDVPLANLTTMERQIQAFTPHRRDYATVLAAFAGVAAMLAAIGIYGVMAYSVAQRTREIGIRMALGAGALDVMTRVGRRAVWVIAIGLSSGGVVAAALMPLLQSQLWEVSPGDPVIFMLAGALLVTVAAIACAVPAWRAAAVDPSVALRTP